MTVTTLTRFKVKPGAMEEAIAMAKRSKAIFEKLGATEARLGSIYTGMWAGQLVFSVRYSDWDSYGGVQAAARQDPEYQSLMAEFQAGSVGELEGRSIIDGIDL